MDLNDVSTADFLDNRISAKNGPFYETEKVLSHRLWRIFPLVMALILHWFHLQKSLIFVVKRQCLSQCFFQDKKFSCFARLLWYVLNGKLGKFGATRTFSSQA